MTDVKDGFLVARFNVRSAENDKQVAAVIFANSSVEKLSSIGSLQINDNMTCQTITTFQDISMLVGAFVIGVGATIALGVVIGYICVIINDAFSGN